MSSEKATAKTGLPVEVALPALRKALKAGHVVLHAPPGSGKTTRVPLALLDEPWLAGRKIVLLEPRRPAARLAAAYMARCLGEGVAQTVGYQVRFDRQIGVATRIEVLTEGVLAGRLQSDPELTGVGLVIFDEFHERNLQTDLALALCLDVTRGLRDDLRLLIMSATLETTPLEALLPARAVTAAGHEFPVTTHFAERSTAREAVPAAIDRLIRRTLALHPGDVLVFLPGKREIRQLKQQLAELSPEVEVAELHGDLPGDAQDRVLNPAAGANRRVILSTDLAESSVTIPGVGAVVDSGLARKPRFDPNTGLTRLETVRIARDAAAQRAGRAGRLGPGACYRVWTEAEHRRLAATRAAEIRSADLAGLVLELAQWGVQDPRALAWLDPPPPRHWQQAVEVLQRLAALDVAGRITSAGRAMARLPIHPRLAHLLLAAGDPATRRQAADLAAVLSERDPWRGGPGPRSVDIRYRLEGLQTWRETARAPSQFDAAALRRIERAARQLMDLVGEPKGEARGWSVGALMALAYPDRIAQRRAVGRGRFLLATGREVRLAEDDPLASRELLVIAHLDAGRREARAWLAAPYELEELERVQREQLVRATRLTWDTDLKAVVARREQRLGALVLAQQPAPVTDHEAARAVLLHAVQAQGLQCLEWSEGARTLQARILTMRSIDPEGPWPDVSDAWLLEHLPQWLFPGLDCPTRLEELRAVDLRRALLALLDWRGQQRLDELAPEFYRTPAGTRRRIRYRADGPPELPVALQELFGVTETPTVAGGRLPLLLHLLSPAGRPLQITADLVHFWRNAYQDVRKEMRGRYPKHSWPEDPLNAPPGRASRRRSER